MVLSSLNVRVSFADPTQPHGVITLTFDDSWQSQYSNAFPLMQARGMVGTFYEITNDLSTNATDPTYLTIRGASNNAEVLEMKSEATA